MYIVTKVANELSRMNGFNTFLVSQVCIRYNVVDQIKINMLLTCLANEKYPSNNLGNFNNNKVIINLLTLKLIKIKKACSTKLTIIISYPTSVGGIIVSYKLVLSSKVI